MDRKGEEGQTILQIAEQFGYKDAIQAALKEEGDEIEEEVKPKKAKKKKGSKKAKGDL